MPDIFDTVRTEFNRINAQWNRRSQLTHVLVASTLISMLTYFLFDTTQFGLEHSLVISFLLISPSVMFHELSHVFAARELGFTRARYVAYLPFLALSCAITLFLGAPLFLLPGFAAVGINIVSYPVEWYYTKIPSIKLNIRNRNEAIAFIGIGGPLANLVLVVISTILLMLSPFELLSSFLSTFIVLNFGLMAFNMVPLPGLDGSKILRGNKKWFALMWLAVLILGIGVYLLNSAVGAKLLF